MHCASTRYLNIKKVEDIFLKKVHGVLLTLYSTNKGIKLFGTKGTDAVETKLRQLHDRKVIKPVLPADLSKEQKWKSLAYLMFIKEKCCGKIKGRGCADGRKQRGCMDKEDTSSPTVSTQALILS